VLYARFLRNQGGRYPNSHAYSHCDYCRHVVCIEHYKSAVVVIWYVLVGALRFALLEIVLAYIANVESQHLIETKGVLAVQSQSRYHFRSAWSEM
jgi:hypothetical protein